MARPPIDRERRRKIVDATLRCIKQFGYAETTVARICADVGLSAGNIHYYFGGKDKLLEEAMRTLLRDIRAAMVANLSAASAPRDRLTAIVEANFLPALFNEEICIVWLHFWAQAPHTPELARFERVNRIRFLRNLAHELKQLTDPERAQRIARQLVAMVDGFWIEKAQRSADVTPAFAVASVLSFLDAQLAAD